MSNGLLKESRKEAIIPKLEGKSWKEERRNQHEKRYFHFRHPLSKSTETILLKEDNKSQPMLPNKKSGTPDVWVPRTVRA